MSNIVETKELKNYIFYQLDAPDNELQTVSLLFKTGSIQEKKNANGSAHVLEHMIVHYISESWQARYDEPVLCIGRTEYDYILIRIDFVHKEESEIQYCFDIFNQILEGKMLEERLFNMSLGEVIEEYLCRERSVEEQRRIISEVTCKDINHHPVGAWSDLKQLKFLDIMYYFFCHLKAVERAIILMGNNGVSDKDMEHLKLFSINKVMDNVSISKQVRLGKFYTDQLLRRFLISYAQIGLTSMERLLLMNVLEQKYNMYVKGRIGIFDKSISKDYQFIYLSGNIRDECSIDLVKKKIHGLSCKDLDSSKKCLSKYINEYKESRQVQNITSKLEAIIRNFLYGDDILFIDNYDMVLSSIENVQLNQIKYKIQNNI